LVCFKCNGSGVNKRGKDCKTCEGQGKLEQEFYQQIMEYING